LDRVPVDLVHPVLQADRLELVVARVEGHGRQELRTGSKELAVELRERVRMLDRHLGRERSGLHVSALLELEQVATVAQNRTLREALEDSRMRHRSSLPRPAGPWSLVLATGGRIQRP